MSSSPDVREARIESWDLFCRVLDNYGDIGVAWRLARQLASDQRRSVRLFVDHLYTFMRIEPRVDERAPRQRIDAIEIVHLRSEALSDARAADVVVELFGCSLPPNYLDAMVRDGQVYGEQAHRHASIWIDLDYLSAESWVDEFHRLPSPHPTLPLVKYFFYPGFSARSGGLLNEPGLDEARHAFTEDGDQVEAFWRRLQVPRPALNERRVSLFAYANATTHSLFEAMASDRDARWSVILPEDGLSDGIAADYSIVERGALTILTIPLIAQDDYDRLLWSCDINFVRGEDSFMRAQWAARPFVWHIYPQSDDAHLVKLNAFEARYEAGLPQTVQDAQRALWLAWNTQDEGIGDTWARWCDVLPELSAHAEVWRQSLASQEGLVDKLASFVAERRADLLK